MTKPLFLKQYEGVTSGSFMGRDDGYSETKYVTYASIDALSKDFGKRKEEYYFKLVPISKEELEKEVATSLETQRDEAKNKQKVKLEQQIQQLQNELKKLES